MLCFVKVVGCKPFAGTVGGCQSMVLEVDDKGCVQGGHTVDEVIAFGFTYGDYVAAYGEEETQRRMQQGACTAVVPTGERFVLPVLTYEDYVAAYGEGRAWHRMWEDMRAASRVRVPLPPSRRIGGSTGASHAPFEDSPCTVGEMATPSGQFVRF